MAIIIIDKSLTKEDIKKAREEYDTYIKITADIAQEVVAIGGEYHADAEKILVEKFGSKNSDIWGGGYNIETKTFETNALINLKPLLQANDPNIPDIKIREDFLMLVRKVLKDLESLI